MAPAVWPVLRTYLHTSFNSSFVGKNQSDAVAVEYASATPAAYSVLATSPALWRATIAAVAARPVPQAM